MLSIVSLGMGSSVSASTIQNVVNFTLSNQDMWGSGSAADVQYDQSFLQSWRLDPNDFSFSSTLLDYSFGSIGTVGIDVGFNATSGSVDIHYPVDFTVSAPDSGSYSAGDPLTIGSSFSVLPSASIDSQFPTVNFFSDFILDLRADANINPIGDPNFSLTICDEGVGAACNTIGHLTKRLFDVNANNSGQVRLFEQNLGVLNTPSTHAQAHLPVPNVGATRVVGDTLTASGDDDFLLFNMDVDRFLTDLNRLPPLESSAGPIDYNIFDLDFLMSAGFSQTLMFDPMLLVRYDFSTPVELVGSGGASLTTWTGNTDELLTFVAPAEPLTITPTYLLSNPLLSNQTFFDVNGDLRFLLGQFGISLDVDVDLGFLGNINSI